MLLERPSVIVALLTPFDAEGALDEPALREHVDDLVEAGVDALMPCGTTGEGALLSEDEVVEVVRSTVAAADERVPVLAHVGRPGTTPTLALARRALDEGAQAVAAVVPYYYPVDGDQLRGHYATLVEGVNGAPVYAYTIPVNTHNELEPTLLERLIADGVSGLKDSTKSLELHRQYAEVARGAGESFALYVGTAALVLDSLREGSAGAVLAVANLRPDLCVALVRAWREGDEEEAERLQGELAAVEEGLEGAGTMLEQLKRAVAERMRERGVSYRPELRAPLGRGGRVLVGG
jgi:dihydrodipicolinate synthase/N-acetylneuraminate lyase